MFRFLLLIIIAVPLIELFIIVWASSHIGIWSVISLIILTGLIGTTLARRQGIAILRREQTNMQNGQLPGEEVIDGICIFIGGFALLMPGFITDTIGLILLLPFTRPMFKDWIKAIFQNMINRGNTIIYRRF